MDEKPCTRERAVEIHKEEFAIGYGDCEECERECEEWANGFIESCVEIVDVKP